jgi:glutamate-1-semialdehyde 2,1-aminomutase
MTAGLATLAIITDDPDYTNRAAAKTTQLMAGFHDAAAAAGVPVQIHHIGTMFGLFFSNAAVYDYDTAAAADQDQFRTWFLSMLEQGIYLPPSQFETCFISGEHSEDDIQKTIAAAKKAFQTVAMNKVLF